MKQSGYNENKIKVFVIDIKPVIRYGIRVYLEQTGKFKVQWEADTLAEALETLRSCRPDIVILDPCQPADGYGLTSLLEANNNHILAFSENDNWSFVEDFMKSGGMGFISKQSPLAEITAAVHAVAGGRKWISPSLRRISTKQETNKDENDMLSPREREIVMMIARGLSTSQISQRLCVSIKTVETHRYRIYKKLNIKNRAQMVDFAIKHGLQQ